MSHPIQQHFVRYGTNAEQKYLMGEMVDTYDCVIVNANMVSHAPSALASFIGERTNNKHFLIDPQTHAFQHDIALLQRAESEADRAGEKQPSDKLRKSIAKLVEAYGDPIKQRIQSGQVVLPEDFADPGMLRNFALRVAEFQLHELRARAEDQGLTDYYDFVGMDEAVTPVGIVAPYFYMDQRTIRDWIDINISLVKTVTYAYPDNYVYAQLVISKDVLYDDQAFKEVVERYSTVPAERVLLWIDDFSEHAAPEPLLRKYAQLVREIGAERPVVMLYGSYFSVAMMRFVPNSGLVGVCHGLEYGEDRAVIPAVGGLPVSKFYYPAIHKRVRYPDAFEMARPYLRSRHEFLAHVCGCPMCQQVFVEGVAADLAFALYGKSHPVTFNRRSQVVTLQYPDTDTRERCVMHYMWNKAREYAESNSLDEVTYRLLDAYNQHKRTLGLSEVGHCRTWATVLDDLSRGH